MLVVLLIKFNHFRMQIKFENQIKFWVSPMVSQKPGNEG